MNVPTDTKPTHGLESRIKILEEIDRRVSRLELRMQESFAVQKPASPVKTNGSQALLTLIDSLLTEIEEVDTLVQNLEHHLQSLERLSASTK